jgi:carboxynorspermidine decarboxylase
MKYNELPSPCYLVDEGRLIKNLETLRGVSNKTGCRFLLAQKAFSAYALYPLIGRYIAGTAASGLYEARLGAEEMGGETHVFSTAYRPEEFDEILSLCGHVIFNSFTQLEQYGPRAKKAGASVGLRVNPECSTQTGPPIYDPCAAYSRLGVTRGQLRPDLMGLVDGLHFHTLCEQDADALVTTVAAVEEKFGEWLPNMKWLNLGGGHHITRDGYDVGLLTDCVGRLSKTYGAQVYLEPGEAVALNAGQFITTVLDVVRNGMDIAILDCSAACHMPDVLEMPYRPPLINAGQPGEKAHTYRLAGMTCLAGDIIGDYSFDAPLKTGGCLVFEDMAIYTMVKNNTFNGMRLPSIAVRDRGGECKIIREFGYQDFKGRL